MTCILHKNKPLKNGYVLVHRPRESGKKVHAHRLAWEENFGRIPKGMFVCHECDVKNCVNPDHLFLSTPKGNSEDMVSKGRQAFGEKHGRAKLRESQVRLIRKAYDRERMGITTLGRLFGVNKKTIHQIVRREIWSHV